MRLFDEIKAYIGFDLEDERRLRALQPLVRPCFTRTVDNFYRALEANPTTRDLFDDAEQVARLRKTLLLWLEEVFAGPWNDQYLLKRQRIGRVHVEVGLKPQFMFGAMNIVRQSLIQCVLERELTPWEPNVASINKILDIELTIMLQTYWDRIMETRLQIPAALAAGMAHEIRNPLNAVGLQLTLLDRLLDQDDERVRTVIETVRRELRRLNGLTTEIMDFAKPIELHRGDVDIEQLFEQLRKVHQPSLDMMGVQLVTSIDGPVNMHADASRLHQMLVNLLTNAIDALDGIDDGRIEVSAINTSASTTFTISDNGVGMRGNVTQRLFELFYTTKPSGTGMGLPVVRKIVEAHGGTIDVHSRLGRGTRFVLIFPHWQTGDEP